MDRSRRYQELPILPSTHEREVIELAKHAHQGIVTRSKFQKYIKGAPDMMKELQDDGETAEIFLFHLPPSAVNCKRLIYHVNQELDRLVRFWNLVDVREASMQYVNRCKLLMKKRSACLLLTSDELAKRVVEQGHLNLFFQDVRVIRSTPLLSGLTTQSGSKVFSAHHVQAGIIRDDRIYLLWTSHTRQNTHKKCQVQLCMAQKVIRINFERPQMMGHGDSKTGEFVLKMSKFRLEIPFLSIVQSAQCDIHHSHLPAAAVTLRLNHPPFLFREVESDSIVTWNRGLQNEVKEAVYKRTVDFTQNRAWSRCTILRIQFDTNSWGQLSDFKKRLRMAHLMGRAEEKQEPTFVSIRDYQKYDSELMKVMREANEKYKIPFIIRYEVQILASICGVVDDDLTDSFWHLLSGLYNVQALRVLDLVQCYCIGNQGVKIDLVDMLNRAIRVIERSGGDSQQEAAAEDSESPFCSAINAASRAIIREAKFGFNEEAPPCEVPVRRVVVTPTRILVKRAEIDTGNRVLRKYSKYRARFIRVSFEDENGNSMSSCDSEDLFARIRQILKDGLAVAGDKFVFLAFSSSQLREHGCWMFNETPSVVRGSYENPPMADEIRRWFGVLDSIETPFKYAARMGHAFSSSTSTRVVEDSDWFVEEDIVDDFYRYQFSDGIGMISMELAKQVMESMGFPDGETPSAFQVRYSGIKGVLSVWNNLALFKKSLEVMKKYRIIFRDSMIKFAAKEHNELEVVVFSSRHPFYLNRQIITLLEGLGVSADSFMALQSEYLAEIDASIHSNNPDETRRLLIRTGCIDGTCEGDHLRSIAPMANVKQLLRAGFTCRNCKYLYQMMCAVRRRLLTNLREKARIPIDEGFVGIGVLDEEGVLKENEIFVQWNCPITGQTKYATGDVIVGRSPALHPGDLQMVQATSYPELEHLVDVVVFPKVGERPIPSKLSGGDLDGDVYFVFWDERLLAGAMAYHHPMDYTGEKEMPLNREVNIEDVKDVMIRFMRNDNLGKIANAHLAYADREEHGVFSEICLRLAKLHSAAVDFAKTGVPAKMDGEIYGKLEEIGYPDFMCKPDRASYKSNKALGRMFRAVENLGSDSDDREWKCDSSVIDDIIAEFKYHPSLDEQADYLLESWNARVQSLMDSFGVESEAEICSGQILHFVTHDQQSRGKRRFTDKVQAINRFMKELRKEFRDEFFDGVPVDDEDENIPTIAQIHKACAWYKAAERKKVADLRQGKKPMLSFPFIVPGILARVVAAHLHPETLPSDYVENMKHC